MGVLIWESEAGVENIMEQLPENLSLDKPSCGACENEPKVRESVQECHEKPVEGVTETKIQLSFSVDRLLNCDQVTNDEHSKGHPSENCCGSVYSCCSYPGCLVGNQHDFNHREQLSLRTFQNASLFNDGLSRVFSNGEMETSPFLDLKSVVRPTPIRAMGNNCDAVALGTQFSTLAASTLIRYHHHQQQQQQKPAHLHSQRHPATHAGLQLTSSLLNPLGGMKPVQLNPHLVQHYRQTSSPQRFQTRTHSLTDISASAAGLPSHHRQQQQPQLPLTPTSCSSLPSGGSSSTTSNGKRKRSWSRAVFSNLQRKGLEIQFQQQKYITKPDRRKLAARLNLTDAQVKVWFQNRRMKWRHTRENLKSGQEKQINAQDASGSTANEKRREEGDLSDSSSSMELSENEDNEDEIDVVE